MNQRSLQLQSCHIIYSRTAVGNWILFLSASTECSVHAGHKDYFTPKILHMRHGGMIIYIYLFSYISYKILSFFKSDLKVI
jgi:hypothetical protein